MLSTHLFKDKNTKFKCLLKAPQMEIQICFFWHETNPTFTNGISKKIYTEKKRQLFVGLRKYNAKTRIGSNELRDFILVYFRKTPQIKVQFLTLVTRPYDISICYDIQFYQSKQSISRLRISTFVLQFTNDCLQKCPKQVICVENLRSQS